MALPAASGQAIAPLDTRRYLGEVYAADQQQRADSQAELQRILNR